MQLTELERASAAYSLVERQTTDLHKDAMKIQESVIGQIKEQRSAIENVTNEIALHAIPIELAWLKIKLKLVQLTYDFIRASELRKKWAEENSPAGYIFTPNSAGSKAVREQLEKENEEWENILSDTLDVKPDLNLTLEGAEEELAKQREQLGELMIDLWDDLEDAQENYNDKSEELTEKHNKKLEELDEDSVTERLRIWEDYQNDLAKIEADLIQTIADYQVDFARDSADLDRDYIIAKQDAARKFRENEIKAERDYQQLLKRLREEFLFDLEDALREYDALQVLRLIRRYKLDKEQAEDGHDEERRDAKEAYRRELEDLARKHAEEERDNKESLARQIADAQLAAERKREDARVAFERELADEAEALQRQKEEEAANYADRQAELEKDLEDRKTKILEAFGEEIAVTTVSLDTVAKLFSAFLGEKGVVAGVIDQYMAILSIAAIETDKTIQQMMQSIASLNALSATPLPINQINAVPPGIGIPSHATGVKNKLLTRPQLFMAGEVPEIMNITPVSQLSSGGSNGNGKGTLEILLGSGLEANIIDNTLGEFDMILRRELGKKS